MSSATGASDVGGIDRLLAADPGDVRALLLKADDLAARGDARSASSFYMAALRAAPPAAQTPPELAAGLRRAQAMYAQYAQAYKAYLRKRLGAPGPDALPASSRFAQSLDIILGEKRIYLQEPRYYYFPELPNVQFYERDRFPWLVELEAAADAIRGELAAVLDDRHAVSPYVTGDANRPRPDRQGMLNNPAWSAFYLWKNGEPVTENLARCPSVMRALRNAPLSVVPNRSPSILFSLLRPGAHIPPHHGLVNTRLICHLPLVVPGRCRLRVGNETREWVKDQAWLFDDTIEHEAWNDSDEVRVILLFDVWRPELTPAERASVVQLFEAIDAYSGTTPEWEI